MTHPGDDRERAATAFAEMSRQPSPTLASALITVTAALRPVDHDAVEAELDGLARELFAVEPTVQARARELATLLVHRFGPDAGSVADMCVDAVLTARRGHALLLATVAAELGRRAGWATFVCSSPDRWYTAMRDHDRLWLVDPTGGDEGDGLPPTVRRHCGHELAYAVLSGLADRFTSPRGVCRALELRAHLDVHRCHSGEGPFGTWGVTSR